MKDIVVFFGIVLVMINIGFCLDIKKHITTEKNKEEIKLAHVAPPVFEYAHAYHGILSSHWSEKRKCYAFERDGKEYKLFTKAFWMWYIENYERDEDVEFFYEK